MGKFLEGGLAEEKSKQRKPSMEEQYEITKYRKFKERMQQIEERKAEERIRRESDKCHVRRDGNNSSNLWEPRNGELRRGGFDITADSPLSEEGSVLERREEWYGSHDN